MKKPALVNYNGSPCYQRNNKNGTLNVFFTDEPCEDFQEQSKIIKRWNEKSIKNVYIVPVGYSESENTKLYKDVGELITELKQYKPKINVKIPNVSIDFTFGKEYKRWMVAFGMFITGFIAGSLAYYMILAQ